jgi:hypothetical protein
MSPASNSPRSSYILAVLRERAYALPTARAPDIRDPYFAAAVQAIVDRIKANGWLLVPPSTRWRDDRNTIDPAPSTTFGGKSWLSRRGGL